MYIWNNIFCLCSSLDFSIEMFAQKSIGSCSYLLRHAYDEGDYYCHRLLFGDPSLGTIENRVILEATISFIRNSG